MARPVRVEFKDAVYHVMARGNERRTIFLDDRDRTRFLETLADAVERFGVDVAREYGYRDGAGVSLVVKRLEEAAKRDRTLLKHCWR